MPYRALARQLFAPPGTAAQTRHLLAQAASVHARLLASAIAGREQQLAVLRDFIGVYLHGPASPSEKRQMLDDPEFVEALHALAGASNDLAAWDDNFFAGCDPGTSERAPPACGRLGNVALAVLLRCQPGWCGQIELASDEYGRVHLPFTDWTLVLADEGSAGRDLFGHQKLILDLAPQHADWLVADNRSPLVRMPANGSMQRSSRTCHSRPRSVSNGPALGRGRDSNTRHTWGIRTSASSRLPQTTPTIMPD